VTEAVELLTKCKNDEQMEKDAETIRQINQKFETRTTQPTTPTSTSSGSKDQAPSAQKLLSFSPVKTIMRCKNQASNILQMEQVYERPLINQQIQEFCDIAKNAQPGHMSFQQRYPLIVSQIININSK